MNLGNIVRNTPNYDTTTYHVSSDEMQEIQGLLEEYAKNFDSVPDKPVTNGLDQRDALVLKLPLGKILVFKLIEQHELGKT